MNPPHLAVLLSALAAFALGAWLLLPQRHGKLKPRRVHLAGGLLVALAAGLLAGTFTPPGDFFTRVFFYGLALLALAGGVLTVTHRDPVFNALSFALVLLAVSGLFLLVGAQFLAAGTVIVYAGAIVVMFLFVIMLAQAEGQALYDRTARAPELATLASCLTLASLVHAVFHVQHPPTLIPRASTPPTVGDKSAPRPAQPRATLALDAGDFDKRLVRYSDLLQRATHPRDFSATAVLMRAVSATSRLDLQPPGDPARGIPPPHVAGLGAALYTDHLVTVELAGAILFVALVGAACIALPRRGTLPRPLAAPHRET